MSTAVQRVQEGSEAVHKQDTQAKRFRAAVYLHMRANRYQQLAGYFFPELVRKDNDTYITAQGMAVMLLCYALGGSLRANV